ncbi:MAG: RNA 2',3'-cyclic phosphodiesterase [Candidatus Kapaibacteriales bacterium]
MRLFIGTFVTDKGIEAQYSQLKEKIKHDVVGKWVEPWNLHFTYHFLGEIEGGKAAKIYKQIQPICIEYESELVFVGLNVFPSKQYPRVLFVNIMDTNLILNKIHFELSKILLKNGIKIDERDFHPHLTLLRIRHCNRDKFQEFLENFASIKFGTIDKFTVDLIQSKLTTEGPKYSRISY